MYGTAESFSYGECGACGSLTLLDPPDDFTPYYPPDYLSMVVDPASLGIAARAAVATLSRSLLRGRGMIGALGRAAPVRRVRTMTTILEAIARVPGPRPRRVLDVGSGSGMVPLALSLAGDVEVLGVDPFTSGDRCLGNHARLRAATLHDIDGEFDLVMFHHSLEHMLDPFRALCEARERLARDGIVLVRVPTVSSLAWREYRTDWIGVDPPRHVWIPSRVGMKKLAHRARLNVLANYDDSNDSSFWASEQARRGIAMTDPRSHYVNPRRSIFSRRQLSTFRRRSRELNREFDGDQTVLYLGATG